MPTTANSLEAWTDTNDALTENLRSVLELLEHEPWSADRPRPMSGPRMSSSACSPRFSAMP